MSNLNDTSECVSDLRIDQLLAHELDDAARAQVQAHVEGCASCRTRRDDIAARGAAYLEHAPSFRSLADRVGESRLGVATAQRRRARGRRGALTALFGLAAAAAALLALRSGLGDGAPAEAGLRTGHAVETTRGKGKDAPELDYLVKRGEQVMAGAPGRILRPGDRVRFTYTSAQPQQFALFNRDGRGVSVYYPPSTRSAPIPPGRAVALDFSVELDDYIGSERVLGVFCAQPFELEPLRRVFAGDDPPRQPPGCTLRVIELHKERAP